MKNILGIWILVFLLACAHFKKTEAAPPKAAKTVLSVKVSRQEPKENCEPYGVVRGIFLGLKPNMRKALEEMRSKAFERGANYVRLDSSAEAGTSVQGMSFKCPEN